MSRLLNNWLAAAASINELKSLDLSNNSIKNLQGLENSTNLTNLILSPKPVGVHQVLYQHNFLADLKPLAKLTKLTNLELGYSGVTNIQPLSGHYLATIWLN
jgi:Leucine-rich repeat (LRR) protein